MIANVRANGREEEEERREETRENTEDLIERGIVVYRFSKSFSSPPPVPFVFFPSSRIATFFLSLASPIFSVRVPFCLLRYEEHRIYVAVVV